MEGVLCRGGRLCAKRVAARGKKQPIKNARFIIAKYNNPRIFE
jgi:hypothetical protein